MNLVDLGGTCCGMNRQTCFSQKYTDKLLMIGDTVGGAFSLCYFIGICCAIRSSHIKEKQAVEAKNYFHSSFASSQPTSFSNSLPMHTTPIVETSAYEHNKLHSLVMGNSNSSAITINLDRNNPFYFSNEIVSGTVGLNILQGKIEANEIYVSLTGEIGYTTTRTVSNSRGQSSTRTEYHHVPFYSAKGIFAQPEVGQTELVLNQGQYSWPFQISLTDYLPPTLNYPHAYPHVRYYLQVVIDKPWYKPNTRETQYLSVYPRVNLLHMPQCLVSTCFGNQNRKHITLRGTLNKLGYVPGELITFTLDIDNPRKVLIQHIDLSMLQSYRIGQNTRGYTIFQTTLPKICNTKEQQIRETYAIVIPLVSMAPSYQFQGGITRSAFVNITYLLRFAVKVEGMFTDFDVKIPITVGTEPNPDFTQQQTFNPLTVTYSSNPEQSMFIDNDELPPAYDSIVQNTK
ncbi:hypothetical protein I4U23_015229 [Adineta vaga]|nr:hypothetical protein I4U23_015229 [Adineta vaga]